MGAIAGKADRCGNRGHGPLLHRCFYRTVFVASLE